MYKYFKKCLLAPLHFLGFDIFRTTDPLLPVASLPIVTIIDIGANRGQFALKALKLFPNARIYCFEPLPQVVQELRHILGSYLSQVTILNCALGEKENTHQEFYLHLNHDDSSSILRSTSFSEHLYPATQQQHVVSVPLTTLDKAMEPFLSSLQPELLVKMDVQGYEDRVIRGGPQTLARACACIVEICLTPFYEHQATFKDIFEHMDRLGFRYAGNIDQVIREGQILYIDALFTKPPSV